MRRTALVLAMVLFSVGFAFAGSQSLEMTPLGSRSANNSFLYEEAGMSAYAQLDGTIDLAKAESALKTVEEATGEYVIGSVGLEGYDESHDVHIYVDSAGWIIAYYLADEKASKIVNWLKFAESGSLMETKVRVALSYIAENMQLFPSEIKYYDFRYPDAAKMMIIADNDEKGFRIKIPSETSVYSRTWALYVTGSNNGILEIDGVELQNARAGVHIGAISISQLSPDEFHEISIRSGQYTSASGAIMLIYKE